VLAALWALGCGPAPGGGGDPGDDRPGAADAAPEPAVDARVRADAGPVVDAGPCTDVIDVVFVLDTSSSMGFVLDTLAAQIGDVVVAANRLAPDAHFGLIPFQDNHVVDARGPGGSVVHTAASTLTAAFRHYRFTYTGSNRNPGDGPTGRTFQNPVCEENSLDALYAAAVDFPWRANATRVVIIATDDTFLERGDNYGDRDHDGMTNRTDSPREGNYPALRTFAETVAALRSARIRVFAFSRITAPGFFDRCDTPRRFSWDDISDGWSTPYGGAEPFPAATDGRNFDIAAVEAETLSLTATINEVVLDSYCNPPVD
jgi:hypothetical protein